MPSIVGLRNRLIHGYHLIDNKIIWDIANEEAPKLAEQLDTMLNVEPSYLLTILKTLDLPSDLKGTGHAVADRRTH